MLRFGCAANTRIDALMRVEKTVFISYRHTNQYLALLIYKDLKMNGYDVFYDYESIGPGSFSRVIEGEIDARAHFIVLLAQGALKRCEEPGDWLRREIEFALDKQRNIIPLMFDGFNFKKAKKYLTGKLALLSEYQGVPISVQSFDICMTRLRDQFLNRSLDTILHPAPEENIPEVKSIIEVADNLPTPTEAQLTAEQYFEQANRSHEQKDYKQAIENYKEVIRLNPEFVEAYCFRAEVRIGQEDYAGAMVDYTEAIRVNPHNDYIYYSRGRVHSDRREYTKAIIDYTEAIRLNPLDEDFYYLRGLAYSDHGDDAKAIIDFTEAIRLKPEVEAFYYCRALEYSYQGEDTKAIIDFIEVIRLNPKHDVAYDLLIRTYDKIEDYINVIKYCNELIKIKPSDARSYYYRGKAYFMVKDYTNAIADYEELIRIDPQDGSAYAELGNIHFQQKNYNLSIVCYEKAIALNYIYIDLDRDVEKEPPIELVLYLLPEERNIFLRISILYHIFDEIQKATAIWRQFIAYDEQYKDADWVGKELNWRPELIEEARKLIAKL